MSKLINVVHVFLIQSVKGASTKLLRLVLGAILLGRTATGFAGDCNVADYGALPVEIHGDNATTVVKINGQEKRFILDTGAFFSVMSLANADALKLVRKPAPEGFYMTGVGGDFNVQVTRVAEFGILGASLHDVEFVVGGSDFGTALLGANLLDAMDLDIDLTQGKLHLMKPTGCGKRAMAYWAQDGNYQVTDLYPSADFNDRRSFVTVQINGKSVRALLDTGAPTTMLSRQAASRVGIDLKSAKVREGDTTSGFGAKNFIKTWIVPIDTFSIGGETVQHGHMRVIDGDFGSSDQDMLLGLDFFLAHHFFIANSQKKIYFTYNGGRVFSVDKAPLGDSASAAASSADSAMTAEDYALRGQAHLSRGETAAAIADLDSAIRMAPDKAAYYLARARAHLAVDATDAAVVDAQKSIDLDPKNIEALLLRARLRMKLKDDAGAESDVAAARQLAPVGSAESQSIANFYLSIDRPAAAIPLYDDWIRLHDNDSQLGLLLNRRCWALGLANQQLDAALADCKKAIRRDGPLPSYLDSLGLIQLRQKNYAEAIDDYRKALSKNARLSTSRYGLGLAEIRSGQSEAGISDLVAAKAMAPDIEEWFTKFGI